MSPDRSSQPTVDLDISISGGSMGGLFTGLAVAQAGHTPTIFEQSTGSFRSRGGGIVAQGNVRAFLDRYTSTDPAAITTSTSERRFLTATGDVERSVPDSTVFTSWDGLYRALRDAFPAERYHMGTADLVVAAEGGQSSTRERVCPGVTPSFAAYVAWRGVLPEAELPAATVEAFEETFTFYRGSDQLILGYFIPGPAGETTRGDRRLNWVWYDGLDSETRPAVFTDTTGTERRFTVPPGQLRSSVRETQVERAKATLPPAFRRVVEGAPELFVQAIYDLQVPRMVNERLCLLGDAAFVARPHTAAGTAKAAGDAVGLAEALADHGSLDGALRAWERARSAYGGRLVERGQEMGEERLRLGS